MLAALTCEGHVLFEDVPGTAKTVLARAIAQSVEGIDQLADPVHAGPAARPTSRASRCSTRSDARLRVPARPGVRERAAGRRDQPCDAEDPVGAARGDGRAPGHGRRGHARLPDPFLLLATENPIEHEGTFPLPEAQLDRFFLMMALGYPGADDEVAWCGAARTVIRSAGSSPWSRSPSVRELAAAVEDVYVDELLERWIVGLVRATRELRPWRVGASVRGKPRARADGARAGRSSTSAPMSRRRTSSGSSLPVLGHRIVFTPGLPGRTAPMAGSTHSSRSATACFERGAATRARSRGAVRIPRLSRSSR